jgi:hypothetical protein
VKEKALYLTVAVATVVAFMFTMARYVWAGGSPSHRLGYGIFVSVVPALVAFLLFRLIKFAWSWQRAVAVYFVLFILISIIQGLGRMIPGSN